MATSHTGGRGTEPGTRVIAETAERQAIDGRDVEVVTIEWNSTSDISVDVSVRSAEGGEMTLLTGEQSLDGVPTLEGLRAMIAEFDADPTARRYRDFN